MRYYFQYNINNIAYLIRYFGYCNRKYINFTSERKASKLEE